MRGIQLGKWHLHPAVRTGDALSFGERAADKHENSQKLITLQQANTDLTLEVRGMAETIATQTAVLDEIHRHVSAMSPGAGTSAPGTAGP